MSYTKPGPRPKPKPRNKSDRLQILEAAESMVETLTPTFDNELDCEFLRDLSKLVQRAEDNNYPDGKEV
jgi:hypothetical protein